MQIEKVRQLLRAAGAKPSHEQALLRAWTQATPLDGGKQRPENFFPLSLRSALPALELELAAIGRLSTEHAGGDGGDRRA